MMQFLIHAFLASLVLPAALSAAPISVRSGEHPTFTRLVMQLPEGVSWTTKKTANAHTINLSGHTDGFDTETVFNRVPQTRLVSITASPSELRLLTGCKCEVTAILGQNRYLIVDVTDGIAPTVPAIRPPQRTTERTRSFRYGDLLWSNDAAFEQKTSVAGGASTADLLKSESGSIIVAAEERILEETRNRLVRGIGEASTRGILTPSTPNIQLAMPEPSASTDAQTDVAHEAEVPVAETGNADRAGHIRVTSSQDVPNSKAAQQDAAELSCPNPEAMGVEEWGTDQPFAIQIGTARKQLVGEFDQLDEVAAIDLARLYLFFGFGAEAKQVLGLSPKLMKNAPYLTEIADILENSQGSSHLQALSHCDSAFALWALLAGPSALHDHYVNTNAALRALAKLPAHLRLVIAPELSNRLLALGDIKNAAVALRHVERLPQPSAPAADLAKAVIELEKGKPDDANALLTKVVNHGSSLSPLALMKLVDNQIAEGQPISSETTMLVEAYVQEYKGDELAPDLQRTYVLALADSSRFSAAFETLETMNEQVGHGSHPELTSHILAKIAQRTNDVIFLEYMLNDNNGFTTSVFADVLLDIATRLSELGFADEASMYLDAVAAEDRGDAYRLSAANIALAMGLPIRAEAELSGLHGPEIDRLRAEARLMDGDNVAAQAFYKSADDTENAAMAAWLSEDWASLVSSDNAIFGPVQALSQNREENPEQDAGLLARSNSVLDQSIGTRSILTQLLSEVSVTTPAQP